MPDGTASAIGASDRLFDRLPPNIHAGLTAEQRAAIALALRERQGAPPPINIRFSLPLPRGRAYFSVLCGRDRRGGARRHHERRVNPLRTTGNFLFVIAAALGFYAVAVAVVLTSSIIPS